MYVAVLAIGLGLLLVVGAAVLPVSATTERFGPFRVDLGTDNCGSAVYVTFHRPGTDCGRAGERRLLSTTPIGLLLVALGMAVCAGGDTPRRSRIDVPTPRARRRPPARHTGG